MIRILIISLLLTVLGQNSYSQSQEQVYAGVILHIMKYVEWPSYDSDMSIGVVNSPLLVKALQKASQGKKIHFKNVTVSKFDQPINLKNVDVLFFSKKVIKSVSPEVIKAAGREVLVITEGSTNVNKEVCVNFIQQNGSLKFELYSSTINKNGLKISDQLKKLAILK